MYLKKTNADPEKYLILSAASVYDSGFFFISLNTLMMRE
ncbi:hypothetical protein GTPT_0484 [Tatumella ptyseos ATCC 33301]|uniref:Uncharacterized protein n=1 Tax=Tatumella ptyseos ATCC 33301 TaxID=1005995 RepID=A0A085JPB4_9GAMM|nr:hypothetical protein GTPT_0484 [Tatumella ptyseos ATCC 33301]